MVEIADGGVEAVRVAWRLFGVACAEVTIGTLRTLYREYQWV